MHNLKVSNQFENKGLEKYFPKLIQTPLQKGFDPIVHGGGHSEFGNNKITNCGVAVPLVIGVRKMFFNHFKSRQTV